MADVVGSGLEHPMKSFSELCLMNGDIEALVEQGALRVLKILKNTKQKQRRKLTEI